MITLYQSKVVNSQIVTDPVEIGHFLAQIEKLYAYTATQMRNGVEREAVLRRLILAATLPLAEQRLCVKVCLDTISNALNNCKVDQ